MSTIAADVREVRLPTPDEFDRAYRALCAATEAVAEVAWLVREVASTADSEKRPEFEAPTFELIGRLFVYADDARSRLDEMSGYVDDVLKNIITLADVRERLADPKEW